MTMGHMQSIVHDAPVNDDHARTVSWEGVNEALLAERVDAGSIIAASWCTCGTAGIEAPTDSPMIALVHPGGVIATTGRRKMFGGVKYSVVPFHLCRDFGPVDHEDPRGLGKFCIEFTGTGGVLLGRLQWTWRARHVSDPRRHIMAVAGERDRILAVVSEILN